MVVAPEHGGAHVALGEELRELLRLGEARDRRHEELAQLRRPLGAAARDGGRDELGERVRHLRRHEERLLGELEQLAQRRHLHLLELRLVRQLGADALRRVEQLALDGAADDDDGALVDQLEEEGLDGLGARLPLLELGELGLERLGRVRDHRAAARRLRRRARAPVGPRRGAPLRGAAAALARRDLPLEQLDLRRHRHLVRLAARDVQPPRRRRHRERLLAHGGRRVGEGGEGDGVDLDEVVLDAHDERAAELLLRRLERPVLLRHPVGPDREEVADVVEDGEELVLHHDARLLVVGRAERRLRAARHRHQAEGELAEAVEDRTALRGEGGGRG